MFTRGRFILRDLVRVGGFGRSVCGFSVCVSDVRGDVGRFFRVSIFFCELSFGNDYLRRGVGVLEKGWCR